MFTQQQTNCKLHFIWFALLVICHTGRKKCMSAQQMKVKYGLIIFTLAKTISMAQLSKS